MGRGTARSPPSRPLRKRRGEARAGGSPLWGGSSLALCPSTPGVQGGAQPPALFPRRPDDAARLGRASSLACRLDGRCEAGDGRGLEDRSPRRGASPSCCTPGFAARTRTSPGGWRAIGRASCPRSGGRSRRPGPPPRWRGAKLKHLRRQGLRKPGDVDLLPRSPRVVETLEVVRCCQSHGADCVCSLRGGEGNRSGPPPALPPPPAGADGALPRPGPPFRALPPGLRGAFRAHPWLLAAVCPDRGLSLPRLRHLRQRRGAGPLRGVWPRLPDRLLLQAPLSLPLLPSEARAAVGRVGGSRAARGGSPSPGRPHPPQAAADLLPLRPPPAGGAARLCLAGPEALPGRLFRPRRRPPRGDRLRADGGRASGLAPHMHVLLADGGWLQDGSFRHLLCLDSSQVEKLFRAEVLRLLVGRRKIGDEVVESLLPGATAASRSTRRCGWRIGRRRLAWLVAGSAAPWCWTAWPGTRPPPKSSTPHAPRAGMAPVERFSG